MARFSPSDFPKEPKNFTRAPGLLKGVASFLVGVPSLVVYPGVYHLGIGHGYVYHLFI
jgi:hypothetical protein